MKSKDSSEILGFFLSQWTEEEISVRSNKIRDLFQNLQLLFMQSLVDSNYMTHLIESSFEHAEKKAITQQTASRFVKRAARELL